ncbi:tetratricopeptide repeat protein, partial [Sphaerisporangium aureirubrum]|uniref:tetratricopeptide repeat protein n=1 Tax=Sphaerisporangium aureirubrum TaxID=1544736 RepID=UPI00362AB1D4
MERRDRAREAARVESERNKKIRQDFDAVGELPTGGSRAGLLRPEEGVVPFAGRQDERGRLAEWCAGAAPVSVLLLTGAGGVGKTRLVFRVMEDLPKQWSSKRVDEGQEVAAVSAAVSLGGWVLLVVDYAETRAGLPQIMAAIARVRAEGVVEGRLRVLLVARQVGEWWDQLGADVPVVRELVEDTLVVELAVALDDQRSDADVVRAALPYFADRLGVDVPQRIVVEMPGGQGRLPVLVLHAAALVAVLDRSGPTGAVGSGGVRAVVDMGVLGRLLGHESRLWRGAAQRAGLGLDLAVLKQVVAVMALFGVTDEEQAHRLLGRIPDLHQAGSVLCGQILRWLHVLYPGRDGIWLDGLRPDLIAERHVTDQLFESSPLRRACLIGMEPDQAAHALTVLSRATTHHDHARGIIGEALRADLANLAGPAIVVAVQTGITMGDLLAAALDQVVVPLADLQAIATAIPYPTVALAQADAVATRRICDLLPADADPGDLARWYGQLSVTLAQIGNREDALAAINEAVTIRRTLADAHPDAFLPDLATSLNNQSNFLSGLGRREEAVAAINEAVTIRRTLADARPDAFLPKLAMSLNNQANRLSELGRREEALAAINEAVT